MFGSITSKVMIGQFAVIICMIGLGYWYYSSSQNTIMQLNKDNAKLMTAVQLQEQTIEYQKQAATRQNAAMFDLQQNLANAEVTKRDLEARLRRADLQAMARSNAAELEAKINRATIQAFRDIETITTPKDRPSPAAPPIVSNKVDNAPSNSTVANNTNNSPQPPPRPPVRAGATQ